MTDELRYIGKETPRLAAKDIVTGRAQFARDLKMKGMLYAKVLRSPHAHATIVDIDTSMAERLLGVVAVLTHKNSPDWYLGSPVPHKRFLGDKVHYVGDAVAVVAAKSEAIAEEALDLIKVSYEPLPAVYDIEEAMLPDAPQLFPEELPGNVVPGEMLEIHKVAYVEQEYGDPEKGFKEADVIEDGEASLISGQNPLAPEAPGLIAAWDGDYLTLWGSMSSPGLCRIMCAPVLNIPVGNIRVIASYVGGSYGSKHFTGNCCIIAYAAALAKVTRKPVALFFSKEEQFTAFTIRMNSRARYKIGMKRDGTVTALTAEWHTECGALSTEQAMMVGVGLIAQPVVSKCSNVKITTAMVMTNKVPSGPYRGFGYLENSILLSSVLFKTIQKIDLDPVEYFRKNRLQVGDKFYHAYMCTGFETSVGPDIIRALEEGAAKFKWKERWKGWGKPVAVNGSKVRAVGVALAGQSDSGEQASNANVMLSFDGSATVQCCATEFGTGTRDVIHKIAAETLKLPLELVRLAPSDTLANPYEWGSTGSRSTYSLGYAVMAAANDAKRKLFERAAPMMNVKAEDLETRDGLVYVKNSPRDQLPWLMAIGFNSAITGVGNFMGAYNVTLTQVQFIEIEVDLETGSVKVLEQLCATDCGKIINPLAFKGQLDGYFPGLDLAIMEESVWDKNTGRLVNPSLIDYKTRTFNEMPAHNIVVTETPPNADPPAPFGAFGAGEPSLAPAIPAIIMAIYNATGKWFNDYPVTSAKILKALGKS